MQTQGMRSVSLKALIIVTLGACFYFYDFVLQVSPSVVASSLISDFNINATTLGTIIGVYFYSYTAFQIPAGILFDLVDARKLLTFVIALCATGSLLFALAPNIYLIALGRLTMGAGSAFAFLGALYLCLRWLPSRLFALFVGLTQMLGSLGAASGEAPFAFLINHIGWRATMLAFAIVGYILAFLVFLIVRDPKISRKNISLAKKSEPPKPTSKRVMTNLRQVILNSQTWAIGLFAISTWAPITTFAALWGVPFLETVYHLSNIEAGFAISCIWIGMAIACPIVGWLSDAISQRCIILSAASFIGLISILCIIYLNNLPIGVLYLLLTLIGVAASGQSLSFAVVKDNQPVRLVGTANGFNNMSIVISGALFQPLIGMLLDVNHHSSVSGSATYIAADYHFALTILPVFYLVALLSSMFLIKETHCLSVHELFSLASEELE